MSIFLVFTSEWGLMGKGHVQFLITSKWDINGWEGSCLIFSYF